MEVFFPILVLVIVLGGGRLLIGVLNHSRIRNYIESQGGTVIEIAWHPFGHGWFGEKDSVIYDVRYKNRQGDVIAATCKTGLFSGVYFTHERVVHRAQRGSAKVSTPPRAAAAEKRDAADGQRTVGGDALEQALFENRRLREENRMLREELERLRR